MYFLLQLSTRRKDYVIDALDPAVRDALEGLNEFFADPNWIKVSSAELAKPLSLLMR